LRRIRTKNPTLERKRPSRVGHPSSVSQLQFELWEW
jgi:hypothetical protein